MAKTPSDLILASASTIRARLLRNAGVSFQVQPANIDEDVIKHRARCRGWTARDCALALAEAKARCVADEYPKGLVIGADQILVVGDEWFDKPEDLDHAREQLKKLRGRPHELVTAACVIRSRLRVWQSVSVPRLTMREFSDDFLERYISAEAQDILGSVGAYRLEARGAQLFSAIAGDYFSVLGLPLVELLDFLRTDGTLQA